MKGRLLTILGAACLAMLSCQRRDLTDFDTVTARVRIEADWSACMNTPEGMTVVVYSENGREYLRRVCPNNDGVFLDLPEGRYKALAFSYAESDWKSLKLVNTNLLPRAEARLTPLDPSVLSAGVTEEPMVVTPQDVARWQESHSVFPVYTVPARDLVLRLEARIRFKGAGNLRSISLDISGMAAGVMMAEGVTSAGTQVQTLSDNWTLKTSWSDATVGTATTSIRTLGLPSGCTPGQIPDRDPALNKARLRLLLRDGVTVVDTTLLVGNKFRMEETPYRFDFRKTERTLVLEIGGDSPIVLPEVAPENGVQSGFQAEVSEWQTSDPVEIDIF